MDAVHGPDGLALDRSIDVHVRRLRTKLNDDASTPRYVATVRGIGYRTAGRTR
jgi:DNA-binding response OmpR family regulator